MKVPPALICQISSSFERDFTLHYSLNISFRCLSLRERCSLRQSEWKVRVPAGFHWYPVYGPVSRSPMGVGMPVQVFLRVEPNHEMSRRYWAMSLSRWIQGENLSTGMEIFGHNYCLLMYLVGVSTRRRKLRLRCLSQVVCKFGTSC